MSEPGPTTPPEPDTLASWGAYVLAVRDERVLLTRARRPGDAPALPWGLPGGGIGHGEDPAVVAIRETREQTGLDVTLAATAQVHPRPEREQGSGGAATRGDGGVRLVYEGWVAKNADPPPASPPGAPEGEVAWQPAASVLGGGLAVERLVLDALAQHAPARVQRLAAYVVLRRPEPEPGVLLTQISARGHHAGCWTLPGGGVEHGESPRAAAVRETREETGLHVEVGALLEVDDLRLRGTAPAGRSEDFHGVHLLFAATTPDLTAQPGVSEVDGTTSAVAWVPEHDVDAGVLPVLDVVRVALRAARLADAGR